MSIYIVRADGLLFSAKQLEAVSRLHACRDLGGIVEGVAWVRDNGDIVTENTIRNDKKKPLSGQIVFLWKLRKRQTHDNNTSCITMCQLLLFPVF